MNRSKLIRMSVGAGLLFLIVGLIVVWYIRTLALPFTITIASAMKDGRYDAFVIELAKPLAELTGRRVENLNTAGSVANRDLLVEGGAHLAIIQYGSVPTKNISVLAPLYDDFMLVVVPKDSPIQDIRKLPPSTRVSLGLEGSGMRVSGSWLLEHFGLKDDTGAWKFVEVMEPFTALREREVDVAVVTTGLFNDSLRDLLADGHYRILNIDDSAAFCLKNPSFESNRIPRGFFCEKGDTVVPNETKTAVSTLAVLAAQKDVSDRMVLRTLQALYEHDLKAEFPELLSKAEAAELAKEEVQLHPVSARYFDPYGGIDTLATFLESIAAGKELLFALGAGLYLGWRRWRHQKQRAHDRVVAAMKEHLDDLLAKTAQIERSQMETTDPDQLKKYLDEVTIIKLRALDELTHEDLRSDRMFLIFLLQCGNLIGKIQAKISLSLTTRR